ncbi:MAG: protein kinase, partial [bacterium]|nr:protein kinase [bacterium]
MIPKNLGAYELQEELGQGPSATIFQAINRTTSKQVALKVFSDDLQKNNEVLKALHRAVVISSSLEHQNAVKVYDIDSDKATGYHFIAMEYVDGVALKALLEHYKKFEFTQACRIVQAVAVGLAHAHRNGIYHGGLIPENVVIEKQTGRVVVTDFGVSGVLAAHNPSIAEDPRRVGFHAPEWNGENADAAGDIFSLGALLYHLLTGEYPAKGMVSSPGPALPQMPRLRALIPNLPVWLETLVARCMTADPLERIAEADDIVDELEVGLDSKEEDIAKPQREHFSGTNSGVSGDSSGAGSQNAAQGNTSLLRNKTAGGTLGLLMRNRSKMPNSPDASVQNAEKRLLEWNFEKGGSATHRSSRRSQGSSTDLPLLQPEETPSAALNSSATPPPMLEISQSKASAQTPPNLSLGKEANSSAAPNVPNPQMQAESAPMQMPGKPAVMLQPHGQQQPMPQQHGQQQP